MEKHGLWLDKTEFFLWNEKDLAVRLLFFYYAHRLPQATGTILQKYGGGIRDMFTVILSIYSHFACLIEQIKS